MSLRNIGCVTFITGALLAVSASVSTSGQTAQPASVVRKASIPRLSDGKPNFNGIWQSLVSADADLQDHVANAYAPGGQSVVEEHTIPYLPEGLKKRQDNFEKRDVADTETASCNLPGVPRITYARNLPFQIFQIPKGDKITVLYEYAEAHRFLYTNGSPHPPGHTGTSATPAPHGTEILSLSIPSTFSTKPGSTTPETITPRTFTWLNVTSSSTPTTSATTLKSTTLRFMQGPGISI